VKRLVRLAARRPGPLGPALLLPTWILLGLALVLYVVGVLALAFLAVLVATLRLVLGPPLRLLAGLPGVRGVLARRHPDRDAGAGVAVLEQQPQTQRRSAA